MKKTGRWLPQVMMVLIAAAGAAAVFAALFVSLCGHATVSAYEARTDMVICSAVWIVLLIACVIVLLLRRKRTGTILSEEFDALVTKAQMDELTGLLNRAETVSRITRFLAHEGRRGRHALIIVDLDNFKGVNDHFGHLEGDEVLRTLAAKIRSVFRGDDIIGRIGGDEFIVLQKCTGSVNAVRRRATELVSSLEYICTNGEVSVTVTGSIGISLFDGEGKSYEVLFREADEALYRAKLKGKHQYRFFMEPENAPDFSIGETASAPALSESGAFIQLHALIDSIDGGIALIEVSERLRALYLSHSYVKQMDVSYAAIKASDNRLFDFIYSEDVRQVEKILREGAESGKSVEAVFRRESRENKILWYHMRAVGIPYEDSDKPVLLAIVTDVTNMKEKELNDQARKKQLETVIRIGRVVTFEVDIAKRTLHMTYPTVARYNLKTDQLEDMPESMIRLGIVHPDSVEECRRMYADIYSGSAEGSAVVKILNPDGEYNVERYTYFTVTDSENKPVKALGIEETLDACDDSLFRTDLIEKQIRRYSDNMISVVKVRLTDGSFEILKRDETEKDAQTGFETYSQLIEHWCRQASEPEEKSRLGELFRLEGLKDAIGKGIRNPCCEYTVHLADGVVGWRQMSGSLFVDRYDGTAFAFIRVRDLSERMRLFTQLHIEAEHAGSSMLYSYELLHRVTDAFTLVKPYGRLFAFAVLKITNYSDILTQYGRLAMNDMDLGFYGKACTLLRSEVIPAYDWNGRLYMLFPEIESAEWLRALFEKILKLLGDPAYFQVYEETYLRYQCGIAIGNADTAGFDDLCARAESVLRELENNNEKIIEFSK